jgi:S1-C subfamily serine protease
MRSRATDTSSVRRLALAAALLGLSCASAPKAEVASPAEAVAASTPAARARAGIVSLRVTGQEWNWKTPWAKQAPWTRVVSGIAVEGRRILVADTVFGNDLLVEARPPGSETWTPARVVLSDPEGPLAVVAVDDDAFWDGVLPLPLAERAPREGDVTIHRWQGSGLLDSFPGTVRQVETAQHGLSRTHLLTLEIDAAKDGLGSSEVVMSGDRVVGLLTGRSGDAWIALASPVLRQFLDGVASGSWAGFPRVGIAWQDLRNPALRASLGLSPDEGGVRLVRVLGHGSAAGVLEEGDVLLAVDGVRIDVTGHYEDPVYGRMLAGLLFTQDRRPGDVVQLDVLRDGRRLSLPMTLRVMPASAEKVAPYVYGRGPDYVVVGGLVFQDLTVPYLSTWGDWKRRAPPRLLIAADVEGVEPTPGHPRIVLLTSVLPAAANLGYESLHDLLVERVNGREIGSMDDLRAAFATPVRGFDVVEFVPGQAARRVVLDAAEARAAAARIQAAYGVDALDSESPGS